MWRADDTREELTWETYALKITAYSVANSYVTQIQTGPTEATVALGIGGTIEDSRRVALNTAKRRLVEASRSFDLMVGG